MDEDHSFLKGSLKRMLVAQEILAKYRVHDPEISKLDADIARVVFNWNRVKLGYILQD